MPDNNQSPQIFPEDTNIPPIPSGMAQDTSFPNPIQTITDAPPQEVNTPPKKKFGGRKMIATILGLLVLIGGIAAGIVLVKQQQDIREKAYLPCSEVGDCYPSNYQCTNNYGQLDCGNNKICGVDCQAPCTEGGNRDADCTQQLDGQTCPGKKLEICENGTWGGNYPCLDIADNCPSIQQDCSPVCVTDHPDGDPYCNPAGYRCQNYIGDWAKPKSCFASGSCSAPYSYSSGNYCVNTSSNCNPGPGCSATPDPSCTATTPPGATPTPTPTGVLRACNASCQADEQCSTGYCTNAGVCRNSSCPNDTDCNCSVTNTPTPTPTRTPTPTPTPTPGINAVCSAVKAYDINWNLLTGAQLSALSAGDIVRFTVSGTPANQIDKARFTINGVLGPEITTKKPGTNEYYVEYTIPAGVYSFTVTAQIHHLTLGWF